MRAQALGVDLDLDDQLTVDGLTPAAGGALGAATRLVVDPGAVAVRWAGARPRRTRERSDETRFCVDQDDERGWLLQATDAGTALVSADGMDVACAPDGPAWEELLGAQVLPLIATVRGREVFHAAGVVHAGRAILMCGPQHVGKTSLAAHLTAAGADLLSDDVVAVDERLVAHRGLVALKLRAPEAERIAGGRSAALLPGRVVRGRANFVARRPAAAQPVGALYLLQRAPTGPSIATLDTVMPSDLLGATFNLSVQTPERLIRQLDMCARLASEVPAYRVRIVPGENADELAAVLLEHMAAHRAAPA